MVIGGIKGEDVEQAVELAVAMHENGEETVLPDDYTDTNVSIKVVKLIQSYAKIVNITEPNKGTVLLFACIQVKRVKLCLTGNKYILLPNMLEVRCGLL